LDLAEKLNVYLPCSESVIVRPELKSSGDHRLVMKFGLQNRSRQRLLLPLLRGIGESRITSRQFALRGVPKAIAEISKFLAAGYIWAIETDIKNCFPSFQGDVSEAIPLPKKVIRNVILAGELSLIPGDRLLNLGAGGKWQSDPLITELLSEAQRGIPQGSTTSSIAAELVLADALSSLPDNMIVIAYADNLLALGRTKDEVVSTTNTLWSLLSKHPAGTFHPSKTFEFQKSGPIVFLGHWILAKANSVLVYPEHSHAEKRDRRLKKYLSQISELPSGSWERAELGRQARHYLRSWTSAFSACDSAAIDLSVLLKKVDHAVIGPQSAGACIDR
jgi:hypothetical protein